MQTCDDTAEKISLLIDGMLDKEEMQKLTEHMKICEACRDSYKEMTYLIQTLHDIPQPELIPGLHEHLMETIYMEKKASEKPKRKSLTNRLYNVWQHRFQGELNFKVISIAAAGMLGTLLLISILSAGLSSFNSNSYSNYASENQIDKSVSDDTASDYITQPEILSDEMKFSSNSAAPMDNALVSRINSYAGSISSIVSGNSAFRYTFNINLTVSDLSNAISILQGMNGYTLNSEINQTGGFASLNRRVDLAAYENAKTMLRNLGEIDNEDESLHLLSGQQLELKAQVPAKRNEQERLLQLLSKSASIDILTKVESQLSNVESFADDLQGQLNYIYDEANQPYLYIYLNTKPVVSINSTLSFGSRIINGFKHSFNSVQLFLENSLIFAVGAAMPLLLFAFFIVIVWFIFRIFIKGGGKA